MDIFYGGSIEPPNPPPPPHGYGPVHIGWKETSESSDDSDDHIWIDESHV